MKIFVLLAFMLSITNAFGLSYKREFRDKKLLTQKLLEFQEIDNAIVADPDRVLVDQATTTSTTSVSSFLAQPDVPRALSILPEGTTADVASGSVVVTGTDINDDVITESFVFAANASTATNGAQAFKSITNILFHAQDGTGATFDVGVIDVLGLKRCMSGSFVVQTMFDDAKESTFPTVTYDVDEVSKNTIDINGTLNGAKDIDVLFIQNFAADCF